MLLCKIPIEERSSMPFVSKKERLALSAEGRLELEKISVSRTEPASNVERAGILLAYTNGVHISAIARQFHTNRPKVERCINKALEFGALFSLSDLPRPGRPATIASEAKSWVISLACQKPVELGYSFELWTTDLLAKHIRNHCRDAGHPSLVNLARGTVSKILAKNNIRPHKITYYLERRDPEFETKMAQVLYVYKEVQLWRENGAAKNMVVVSYDEKPGIQAIGSTAPDIAPLPGKYPSFSRDYEYVRHGTLSLMAGIDLLDGHIHGMVVERHRSREFVQFLKTLNHYYPAETRIRIVLDNHSIHISKETRGYLATVPNRFEFIFTPKHGSWLNLIETFFSKMARSMLRGIRVESKQELRERIESYLDEVNQAPVVFKWKYGLDTISLT